MFHVTPILLASGKTGFPSFWRRSLDEFKRQATIAVRMEGLHTPQRARPLISFSSESSLDLCKVMTDKSTFGGFSTAGLSYSAGSGSGSSGAPPTDREGRLVNASGRPDTSEEPAHAIFRGAISTELPAHRPDVQRSGFAAWRTRDRGFSLFGKLLWDIDPYQYLALRVKSDGRKYFVNIQTESIVPTDIHQHLLPSFTPGKWETVMIPFAAFVRTNHGIVVEPQKEMLRQKVRSVGIGVTDRVTGPFELCVADVYATNASPTVEVGGGESGFDVREREGLEGEEVGKGRKEPERILI